MTTFMLIKTRLIVKNSYITLTEIITNLQSQKIWVKNKIEILTNIAF